MESIAIKDFLQYKYLSGLKYAPGGKAAAFVVTNCSEDENGYEGRLWLYDGKIRQLTDIGNEKGYIWEDEENILFPAVRSGKEKKRQEAKEAFTSYYRLNIHGGEAVHAFDLPLSVQRIEKTSWGYAVLGNMDVEYPDYYKMNEDERSAVAKHYEEEKDYEVLDEIPFWFNGGGMINKRRTALFTVMADGQVQRITLPEFDVEDMACVKDQIVFTGMAYTGRRPILNGGIYRLDVPSGKVEKIVDEPEMSFGSLLKEEDMVWLSASKCDRYGLNENSWAYTLDVASGSLKLIRKEECNMYGSVGSDCRYGGGNSWQAKDGSLYYIATREGNAVVLRLEKDGQVYPVTTKAGSVDALAVSKETKEALVIAMYDNHLQELYSLNLENGEISRLSHFNDKVLEGKYVAQPESMTIESEGLSIEGWVMLPKDYDPSKKYGAVLDIHGGPKTVYGPVFYHEMQVWAGMGYFVFFCNPKGGDGRDNEFMDIRGQYGDTDYKNIMDFTDHVLKQYPQIDEKRVCVTGGSYGGFMTNWIIGHTDRFCCAAAQRSISNWLSFYGVSDIGYYFATDQCHADFFKEPEKLWKHSPVRYASNVKTPTLFIHSDQDYRCPLEQGLQMYTALKDRGIDARLCLFHGENHELSRSGVPKHRVRRLTEITQWFEKYSK